MAYILFAVGLVTLALGWLTAASALDLDRPNWPRTAQSLGLVLIGAVLALFALAAHLGARA